MGLITLPNLNTDNGIKKAIQDINDYAVSHEDIITEILNSVPESNTTTTRKFLMSVGSGFEADPNSWESLDLVDIPSKGVANGLATLDSDGLVPVAQIPPSALERIVTVADQTARYALTTATVQLGDTVYQTDTGEMFLVKDTANLGNSSGYQIYNAGTSTASNTLKVQNDTSTNSTFYPLFVGSTSGNQSAYTSSTKFSFNPSTGNLSVIQITGDKIFKSLSNGEADGTKITLTAGESLVFGNQCYISSSDGKAYKTSNTDSTFYAAQFTCLGTISANATGTFLLPGGKIKDTSLTLTKGGVIYLSSSGGITQNKPSTSGNKVQILGYALDSTSEWYYNPSPWYYTVK